MIWQRFLGGVLAGVGAVLIIVFILETIQNFIFFTKFGRGGVVPDFPMLAAASFGLGLGFLMSTPKGSE